MDASKLILESLQRQLCTKPRNPDESADLGYCILAYINKHPHDYATELELRRNYCKYLDYYNINNILYSQYEYAVRLAQDDSDLIYEEMMKLFSLCDNIEALAYYGFILSPSDRHDLTNALKIRFQIEPIKSHNIAELNVERWKSHWFCYKFNLHKSS